MNSSFLALSQSNNFGSSPFLTSKPGFQATILFRDLHVSHSFAPFISLFQRRFKSIKFNGALLSGFLSTPLSFKEIFTETQNITSSINISQAIIKGAKSDGDGGGLSCISDVVLGLRDVLLDDCEALTNGGGLFIQGANSTISCTEMRRCRTRTKTNDIGGNALKIKEGKTKLEDTRAYQSWINKDCGDSVMTMRSGLYEMTRLNITHSVELFSGGGYDLWYLPGKAFTFLQMEFSHAATLAHAISGSPSSIEKSNFISNTVNRGFYIDGNVQFSLRNCCFFKSKSTDSYPQVPIFVDCLGDEDVNGFNVTSLTTHKIEIPKACFLARTSMFSTSKMSKLIEGIILVLE